MRGFNKEFGAFGVGGRGYDATIPLSHVMRALTYIQRVQCCPVCALV